jgi:NADP-dependent 3-hydroxy acid dehydrogenase YdfG
VQQLRNGGNACRDGRPGHRGEQRDRRSSGAGEDIAEAIIYIVTRSRREAVNEVLIRPTEQEN